MMLRSYPFRKCIDVKMCITLVVKIIIVQVENYPNNSCNLELAYVKNHDGYWFGVQSWANIII
jgi:hypothetical protein